MSPPRRAHPPAVEPDDLRRAAADIEEHGAFRLRIEQREAALGGEPRLRAAVDDLEVQPELRTDAAEKFAAVVGDPAGFGGDQPGARERPQRELLRADA